MEEVPILKVVIGREQVQMENNKVKAVKEWSTPTKIKEVESFLGFGNFYQQFIKNFSHTERPLNKLKGKKKWNQTEEHQRAFEELKDKIMSQLVLFLLKRDGKFRVEIDTLSQEQEEKWKPIAFLSKTMQPAERNYEIYDKELLAIVEALTKWRQYLLDAMEKFKV